MIPFFNASVLIADNSSSKPNVYLKRANATVDDYASHVVNTLTGDSLEYIFDFKQKVSSDRDLYIAFQTDCSGTDGSHMADISVDYVLSLTVASHLVTMPKVAQFYLPISVVCNPTGVTYDLRMKRTTVGLYDVNNDRLPEGPPFQKIDNGSYARLDSVDLQQVVSGDTVLFEFDGAIGNGPFNTLYAVLFTEVNQSVYQLIDCIAEDPTHTYTYTVQNVGSQPFSTGFSSPKNSAYAWKLTSSGGNFATSNKVKLKVRMKAVNNSYSYTPVTYKFTSYFYASNNSSISNPANPSSGDRNGPEEYTATSTYFKGNFSGWSTSKSSITFNGKHTEEGYAYLNPFYTDKYATFSPYEFRHLATVDTVIIEIPEGYYVKDRMRFRMSGNAGLANNTNDFYATAHSTSTKNRKVYCIRDMYAANYGPAVPPNTISMSDGQADFTFYPEISSTPRTPAVSVNCTMKVVTDNITYTQAYIPVSAKGKPEAERFTHFTLIGVQGPGIYISTTDVATKNHNAKQMTWNVKLENTRATAADQVWLYVQGPVENIKYGTDIGTGIGGRWVKLTSPIPASGDVTKSLSFDVIPNSDCVNQEITVYPFYNEAEPPGWEPFGGIAGLTDADFQDSTQISGGSFDQYAYHELNLYLNTVESKINGDITSWASTISDPSNLMSPVYGIDSVEVSQFFPVELVFDASASSGPVAQLETKINFPKGLAYDPNSAYLEYNGRNMHILDPAWENKLATLTSAASVAPTSITLKLKEIIGQSDILSEFGSEGTIDGGKTAKLRFRLVPTCSIDMQAEEITAQFGGVRFCDFLTAATGSYDQSHPSKKLILKNSVLPFRSDLTFSIDKSPLISESVTDSANMTFSFRKSSKLTEPLQTIDSVRIEVPLSLSIDGEISYEYPALPPHIPTAITGTIPASDISSYTDDSIRYITWQLPKSYYDILAPLALSGAVTLNYNWKIKTGKGGLIYTDTTRVYAAVRAAQSPHITACPPQASVADSVTKPIVLIPAKIVTLPKDTGYIITDKYGKEIMTRDTIIYNGEDFEFTVKLLYGYTKSIPTVKANSDTLISVGQGNYYFNYGFSVLEDTKITIFDVQLNRYTVYFDTDGGDWVRPVTVIHGHTAPKPTVKPKHDEFTTFYGWYSKEDTTYIEAWDFDTAKVFNDTTIYALWYDIPITPANRKVNIPLVNGVSTDPDPGSYYVKSGNDYKFVARYTTAYPLKVMTGRIIEGKPEEIFGTLNADGEYEYRIRQVRSDIFLTIGPDPASDGGTMNEMISGASIWSHNNKLFVELDKDDIMAIYSVSGQLIKKLKLDIGTTSIPLDRGIYIVTLLKANRVEKILIY